MLIYLLILLLGLAFGIISVYGVKVDRLFFVLFAVLLIFFAGLRDEVGPDWSGYLFKYQRVMQTGFTDALLQIEPGFSLTIFMSDFLGWHVYGVNFICTAIFIHGLYVFSRKTLYPWIAITMVIPYLVYVIAMSGIRQAAAIGLGFYLLAEWRNIKIPAKIALIVAASTFHTSAIFFLIFLVIDIKTKSSAKVLLIIISAAIVLVIQELSSFVDKYSLVYIEKNVESKGALVHVALSAFPGLLYLIYEKRLAKIGLDNKLVKAGAYMALALLPMTFISSTAASRLSLYVSFVQMWAYPALIRVFPKAKSATVILCSTISISIFGVYFLAGSHAFAYVPYKNLLLGVIDW